MLAVQAPASWAHAAFAQQAWPAAPQAVQIDWMHSVSVPQTVQLLPQCALSLLVSMHWPEQIRKGGDGQTATKPRQLPLTQVALGLQVV